MVRHEAAVSAISPQEAMQILAHNTYEGQRRVSRSHVRFLRTVMDRREFDGGEPIRFAALGKHKLLINGYHRLEALASRRSSEPEEMVVVTSHCDTPEEVGHLYASIDRGRGRNIADALLALGTFSKDSGLTQRQVIALMACAPLFSNDLRAANVKGADYASKSAEGRAAVMQEWLEPAKLYFAASASAHFGNERQFLRREVAVVGIATFADQPARSRADEFWRGMVADDGLTANDPRKQCLEFLRRHAPKQGRPAGIGTIAHGVTACWNAWFRGDSLRHVRVVQPRAPLRIMGTRFAKRLEDGTVARNGGTSEALFVPLPSGGWTGSDSAAAPF